MSEFEKRMCIHGCQQGDDSFRETYLLSKEFVLRLESRNQTGVLASIVTDKGEWVVDVYLKEKT